MSSEKKQVLVSEPSKLTPEQVHSRRNFIKWGIVGGLALAPIGMYLTRPSYKNKSYEIVLFAPFLDDRQEYYVGVPTWQTVVKGKSNQFSNNQHANSIASTNKKGNLGRVELRSFHVVDGIDNDIVKISYRYDKALRPPKKIYFESYVYDGDKNLIGQGHSSIVAKHSKEDEIPNYGSKKIYPVFIDFLRIAIPKGAANLISTVRITTTETLLLS